jgi:predicted nucleotidyltransferase
VRTIFFVTEAMQTTTLDSDTERAARVFLQKIASRYDVIGAILFGSRALRKHRPDSDADIAVLLHGAHGMRVDAAIDMAGVAFDVLLETGILVEALPLWEDEWAHPEHFNNPDLIENIRRDGVRL